MHKSKARSSAYLRLAAGQGLGQAPVQVLGETLPQCGCPPVLLVWLSHGLRLVGRRARSGWKGVCSAQSSGALLAEHPDGQAGGRRWRSLLEWTLISDRPRSRSSMIAV